MTTTEAADYLGVTPYLVQRLRFKGDLKTIHVGSRVRLHVDDVNAYIEAQRESAPPEMSITRVNRRRSSRARKQS